MPKKTGYSIKIYRKKFGWGHQGSLWPTKEEAKKIAKWGYSGGPYEKYKIVPMSIERYQKRKQQGFFGYEALERQKKKKSIW